MTLGDMKKCFLKQQKPKEGLAGREESAPASFPILLPQEAFLEAAARPVTLRVASWLSEQRRQGFSPGGRSSDRLWNGDVLLKLPLASGNSTAKAGSLSQGAICIRGNGINPCYRGGDLGCCANSDAASGAGEVNRKLCWAWPGDTLCPLPRVAGPGLLPALSQWDLGPELQ